MAEQGEQRRLAAILSADVVGYSRLMGVDEPGTLAALKTHRGELIDPKVNEHHGRIVKTTGDGFLIEFPSVVEAVTCAVDLQRGMIGRNTDIPEDQRILFRVGINVGDVIVEDDDIYGDGVNIAARLQELADPGGIFISRSARDQVRDKLDIRLEDLGEREAKNIARPLRVFRVPVVEARVTQAPTVVDASGNELTPPDRPSIAVLPFVNMSGDAEQEYFSDGVTEDIITELSRVPELFVIARNSTFAYKGQSPDVRRVAADLGVRYVLEGSVRRAGDRVRISAQFIDAQSGSHLWAERYDRALDDIFAVQDEITSVIVNTLVPRLLETSAQRASRKAPEALDAYDRTMRGYALFLRFTPSDNIAARAEAEAACAIDPAYGLGHTILAWTYLTEVWNAWVDDPLKSLELGYREAQAAVAADERDYLAHGALGFAELFLRRRHDRAISALNRAVELNPNNADSRALLAAALNFAGRPDEALSEMQTAMRLNPNCPPWYLQGLGRAYFMLGRYDEGIPHLEKLSEARQEYTASRALLAALYTASHRIDEAKAEIEVIRKVSPAFNLAQVAMAAPYKDPGQLDEYVSLLRKAGLPE